LNEKKQSLIPPTIQSKDSTDDPAADDIQIKKVERNHHESRHKHLSSKKPDNEDIPISSIDRKNSNKHRSQLLQTSSPNQNNDKTKSKSSDKINKSHSQKGKKKKVIDSDMLIRKEVDLDNPALNNLKKKKYILNILMILNLFLINMDMNMMIFQKISSPNAENQHLTLRS